MASTIRSKSDIEKYVSLFSANDFVGFSAYYAPDVKVQLGELTIQGSEEIANFYRKERKSMNEGIEIHAAVVDETGCALRTTVTFTALVDFPEGYFGFPPISSGERIKLGFIIMYSLDSEHKIKEIIPARSSPPEILRT